MRTNKELKNMEEYSLRTPSNFTFISILLSNKAIEWMNGTTKDNNNCPVSNYSLFVDLLSRMKTTRCTDTSFRRPQIVEPGQTQYSEIQLTKQWNMGRKKIHNIIQTMQSLGLVEVANSRTASMLSFVCIQDWNTN